MSNDDTIAALAGTVPKLVTAVAAFLEAVLHAERGTHVGMVVTATAILEHDLRRCLLTMMPGINRAHKDKLFTGYGPLSTFSGKIDVAFALGVIDKRVFTEINKLRQIRNKMAHSTEWRSLHEEPLVSMLNALEFPGGIARPDGSFGSHTRAFMAIVMAMDEELERFLIDRGETEDIRLLAPSSSQAGLIEIFATSRPAAKQDG